MTKEEFLIEFEKQKHDIEKLKIHTDNLSEILILHLKGCVDGKVLSEKASRLLLVH